MSGYHRHALEIGSIWSTIATDNPIVAYKYCDICGKVPDDLVARAPDMTREKAIETAVRRHMRLGWNPSALLKKGFMDGSLVPIDQTITAIRAHYRAVCRQYGVKDA